MSELLEVEFNPLQRQIEAKLAPTQNIVVTDELGAAYAVNSLAEIKRLKKEVDARRKEIILPWRNDIERVNKYAKGLSEPLDDAEKNIKDNLRGYQIERERLKQAELARIAEEEKKELARIAENKRRLKEQQELEAEAAADLGINVADKQNAEKEALALEQQQTRMKKLQGEYDAKALQVKNTRKKYDIIVTDINLVPRKYLKMEVMKSVALKDYKEGIEIPGVTFNETLDIAIGANTYVPGAGGRRIE